MHGAWYRVVSESGDVLSGAVQAASGEPVVLRFEIPQVSPLRFRIQAAWTQAELDE
ncbi:MAG: hypothetical protein IJ678_00525 [Kiritimatiellae bacterium]|nr:hypothetical protein [Kiritimatiellia bacterium]